MIIQINENWQIRIDSNRNHMPHKLATKKETGEQYWQSCSKYFGTVNAAICYIANEHVISSDEVEAISIESYIVKLDEAAAAIEKAACDFAAKLEDTK